MEVCIDQHNISEYDRTYPDVEAVQWTAGQLDPQVLGLFPNLRVLDCSGSSLTSLQGLLACPQLESLFCASNLLITLGGVENCPRLRVLDCSYNHLVSLAGLRYCPNLKALRCSSNHLVELAEIGCCTNLESIHCYGNKLQTLAGIEACIGLKIVVCESNRLVSLEPLFNLPNLVVLTHANNYLDMNSEREAVLQFLSRFRCREPGSMVKATRKPKHQLIDSQQCKSIMKAIPFQIWHGLTNLEPTDPLTLDPMNQNIEICND
ncbi:Hypothetical protein MVR_LOCUS141 [uncultured virus]|nr:Hypothetical protein MVR_LOCUS141 [uncultured virus]